MKKRVLLSIFIVFLLLILILISYSSKTALIYFFPEKTPVNTKPAYYYEDITLKTKDNLTLQAWYIPAENKTNKAIILAHGHPNNRAQLMDFIPFLHKNYNLLLFDFRASGSSQGELSTFGLYEKYDILAAVDYLNQKNMTTGAIGLSLGGAAIVMSESPGIKAAVLDSSYTTLMSAAFKKYEHKGILRYPFLVASSIALYIEYGIKTTDIAPIKHISNLDIPILIIHGTNDTMVSVDDAYKLNEKAENSEIWITSSEHVSSHILYKGEYERRVLDFFDKNLK